MSHLCHVRMCVFETFICVCVYVCVWLCCVCMMSHLYECEPFNCICVNVSCVCVVCGHKKRLSSVYEPFIFLCVYVSVCVLCVHVSLCMRMCVCVYVYV